MLPIEVIRAADAAADKHKLPAAHVAAITEVESGGKIFATVNGVQRPLILFEPHVFYRLLSGEKRRQAVAQKLASAKWNKRLYPKTQADRWDQVGRAAEIDAVAAFEATSYGVGQVLGLHWKALGFESVKAMVDYMHKGVAEQIDVMLRYVDENGLDDELREGRWKAFARGYNGPAYAKNAYDKKMAAAALRYGGAVAEPDGMLRMGAKGKRVRELQALLVRAGQEVKIDGDFGTVTRDALKAFQKANKLKQDGVYGPETERALSGFRQGEADKPGEVKAVDIDEVKQGAGGIGGGIALETLQSKVDDATIGLQGIDGFQPWLGYGLAALSVIAFGLAAWGVYRAVTGWMKSRQTVEA
jgi:hypothetical protein